MANATFIAQGNYCRCLIGLVLGKAYFFDVADSIVLF
jgi:hypothetical protein